MCILKYNMHVFNFDKNLKENKMKIVKVKEGNLKCAHCKEEYNSQEEKVLIQKQKSRPNLIVTRTYENGVEHIERGTHYSYEYRIIHQDCQTPYLTIKNYMCFKHTSGFFPYFSPLTEASIIECNNKKTTFSIGN